MCHTCQPNSFILGTPKAGTTALAQWVGAHDQAFMTDPKEPFFFNDDFGAAPLKVARTWEQYLDLYASAPLQARVLGEASPHYLASATAVPHIRAAFPEARFIAMLRNPVHIVIAMHNQRIRNGFENEFNLMKAWQQQTARRAGRVPSSFPNRDLAVYEEYGQLGTQIRRLRSQVGTAPLKLVWFDDLVLNPQNVYAEVLAFLGLTPDGRNDFAKVNARKVLRSQWGQKALLAASHGSRRVKRRLGLAGVGTGLLRHLSAWNNKTGRPAPLSQAVYNELAAAFRHEIDVLESETGRDLAHWKRGEDVAAT